MIADYQMVIDDLVSTARDLTQVCGHDDDGDAQLSVSVADLVDKFSAVKQSVRQHRESLDLLPCLSSQDVSHVSTSLLTYLLTYLNL